MNKENRLRNSESKGLYTNIEHGKLLKEQMRISVYEYFNAMHTQSQVVEIEVKFNIQQDLRTT